MMVHIEEVPKVAQGLGRQKQRFHIQRSRTAVWERCAVEEGEQCVFMAS